MKFTTMHFSTRNTRRRERREAIAATAGAVLAAVTAYGLLVAVLAIF
jgi:hypothetical protein